MRGALTGAHISRCRRGIIPACAGSTWKYVCANTVARDHPRMCGEHLKARYPRCPARGSSPHVRGAPDHKRSGRRRLGIIPACAGSTIRLMIPPSSVRDHPRMCGEHFLAACGLNQQRGSSPHVRGAPPHNRLRRRSRGIIPACAGSTTSKWKIAGASGDHPRMCGEHDAIRTFFDSHEGSSPHVRGAH